MSFWLVISSHVHTLIGTIRDTFTGAYSSDYLCQKAKRTGTPGARLFARTKPLQSRFKAWEPRMVSLGQMRSMISMPLTKFEILYGQVQLLAVRFRRISLEYNI